MIQPLLLTASQLRRELDQPLAGGRNMPIQVLEGRMPSPGAAELLEGVAGKRREMVDGAGRLDHFTHVQIA